MSQEFLSVGQVAKKLGLPPRRIMSLYERGFMPPALRAGPNRIIPVADVAKLKEAAKKAGYLSDS